MNKITVLGSGTSTGVPILGCSCKVCQSGEARNKRLRTSALIHSRAGKSILIDASPDLRTQLLATKVSEVHGAVITHAHADHTHGMDDLRPFAFKAGTSLPIFSNVHTASELREKFPYIFKRHEVFKDRPILGGGIPQLDLHEVSDSVTNILGEEMEFFSLPHGHATTLGIRHGTMAYLVDCQQVPDKALGALRARRLELLIIDCLRETPHDTHLHLELALEYIEGISPKLAVLTHLGHEFDYLALVDQLERRGAKNVIPAIDGQSFLYS